MGRGDKKTKKGKLSMGSFGVSRPKKTKKTVTEAVAAPAKTESAPKPKAKAKA